jgi:hypothetical protein
MHTQEKMLCANAIIRRQIYDGLVNLLVRCGFRVSSSEADALHKLKLFLEIFEAFGVRETPLIAHGWTHLRRALSEGVAGISAADFASLDAAQQALIFGVAGATEGGGATPRQCVAEARVRETFMVASQLYTSPYVDRALQTHVVSFVQHSVHFLHRICLVGSEVSPSSSRWFCGDTYTGGADFLLEQIITCGAAMTDYSCFSLKAALDLICLIPSPGDSRTGTQMETISEFHQRLDMLCRLLELSFVRIEAFSALLAGKMLVSVLNLLEHAAVQLERFCSRADRSSLLFAELLCCVVISKVLQALNKLQLLHAQDVAGAAPSSSAGVQQSFLGRYGLQVGSDHFTRTVQSALLAASHARSATPAEYQTVFVAMKTHALAISPNSTYISFPQSLAEEYPQFGRYSAATLFRTWTALSAGLRLLSHCEAAHNDKSGVAADTVITLLESAIDHLSLAAAATVPYIFDSCGLLLQRTREIVGSSEDSAQRDRVRQVVGSMVAAAWTAVMSDEDMDFVTVQTFILLAFDSAALQLLDCATQQQHFEAVLQVGLANRPHVMQTLLLQLCSAWRACPRLAAPFFPYFPSLLVYREPILDDHNRVDGTLDGLGSGSGSGSGGLTDTIFTVTEASRVLGIDKFHSRHISRVLLLDFLETSQSCCTDEEFVSCVQDLTGALVAKNSHADFRALAMIGTELFGEKLRCWQALCVLSGSMTEAMWLSVSEVCFIALTDSCAHGIRVHIEIFFAAMAARFPALLLPRLLDLLLVFNHSPQVSQSLNYWHVLSQTRYCPHLS